MVASLESVPNLFPSTQVASAVPTTIAAFDKLNVEDRLALLWYAYTEMGRSITPAALGSARIVLAQGILEQIKQMSPAAQTQVMTDLASGADTPISRSYGSFSVNTKLGFWYELGEMMQQGLVARIPAGYEITPEANAVLETIKNLDAGQQITVLRNTVVNMGYDPALNDYKRPEEPAAKPVAFSLRSKSEISGISEYAVLSYIENMNAFDFRAAVSLFVADSPALQPPFQKPIIGREAIIAYMNEECQGLKMMPQQGISETLPDGSKQVKVTGKVQTPWFGVNVGMNIAWRFALNPQGEIKYLAVDLLASPQELLNMQR
ncbi:NTF2 domain-containing protein [Synechococcus sp. PCC 7502]|uniref:orange carotenoid protein N-terminal domain-containing protein n=1 Tax=Synechococcus sp. PCC 7502 TaxID=1173263 RepID=UPI00029FB236|nr:orange carotenoid protein N-terminal domain-containing protein [Synechococcus sp. PCC 7502]AFY74032.1 NTF2 domain-containing protein [Synechococcus sp. PCC 7502]